MSKVPITTVINNSENDNIKLHQNFDYTTIADRLRKE